MLAMSALAAARQAVDASAERFEQVAVYRALHMHLVRQSFRHVRDDDALVDARDLLHCQLQARGLLRMTVTTRALTARRRSLREVIKLETAVVDHVSTTQRLVTRKINNDADMSPAGLLLLVSRDGSRKEVDCDPRMGLVRILSSTRGGILACDPRGQAWGLQSELQEVYICKATICVCMVLLVCA